MPRTYNDIGVQTPQVWLPRPGIDLTRWAVVACDQFTSQPDYWRQVEALVGDAPSTLNLVFPEIYLEQPGQSERIQRIHQNMNAYLDRGILQPRQGLVYVERTIGQKTRQGLLLCLDLEKYDFQKGSHSLIRATEGTILERLPPRVRIRQGAPLELPHILVLIDDPAQTVIEPLGDNKERFPGLYDFELMLDSGSLSGYLVDDLALEAEVIQALRALAQPQAFVEKYGLGDEHSVLLFAMGDGNHSLAAAKATWEQLKPQVGSEHPARYALVEIENVHGEALEFEPIHRLLFGVKRDIFASMREFYGAAFETFPVAGLEALSAHLKPQGNVTQSIGLLDAHGFFVVKIKQPLSNLPVGTLQAFLDAFIQQGGAEKMDYVHGEEVVARLGVQAHNIGFLLPTMEKKDLFKTVIVDGALPRKTFSMGAAHEKRFYMECRKIAGFDG